MLGAGGSTRSVPPRRLRHHTVLPAPALVCRVHPVGSAYLVAAVAISCLSRSTRRPSSRMALAGMVAGLLRCSTVFLRLLQMEAYALLFGSLASSSPCRRYVPLAVGGLVRDGREAAGRARARANAPAFPASASSGGARIKSGRGLYYPPNLQLAPAEQRGGRARRVSGDDTDPAPVLAGRMTYPSGRGGLLRAPAPLLCHASSSPTSRSAGTTLAEATRTRTGPRPDAPPRVAPDEGELPRVELQ